MSSDRLLGRTGKHVALAQSSRCARKVSFTLDALPDKLTQMSSFLRSQRIFIFCHCEMRFEKSRWCAHMQRLFSCSSGTFEASSDPSAIPGSGMQRQATRHHKKALLSSCCRLLWIKAAVSPFHAIQGSSLSPSGYKSRRTPSC